MRLSHQESSQPAKAPEDYDAVGSLAASLGFDTTEDETLYAPYISYVQAYWPGKGSKADFMRLFTDLVAYFRDERNPSIQSYINRLTRDDNHFYFQDTAASSEIRQIAVQDNVLLILGLWTLMRGYFVPFHGRRHIVLNYETALTSSSSSDPRPSPLESPLMQLIQTSDLLPSRNEAPSHDEPLFPPPQMSGAENNLGVPLNTIAFGRHSSAGLTESLSIEPRDLNIFRLTTLADVRILWTDNVSRHLLLSKRGQKRYIELFALPCAMQSGAHDVLRDVGIRADVMDEIESSYANLFNPKPPSALHKYIGSVVGLPLWCWCLSCSSRRLRNRTFRKLEVQASSSLGGGRGRRNRRTRAIRERTISGQVVALPFDPLLRELAESDASWWDQSLYENMWPRIVALDRCLQEARPWNFWVLLRDSRDTVQYWTFLKVCRPQRIKRSF